MSRPTTLYDKIWDAHLVDEREDGTCLLYIDRHLVHEVTSPQAFEGLRNAGRMVRRPDAGRQRSLESLSNKVLGTVGSTPLEQMRALSIPSEHAGFARPW